MTDGLADNSKWRLGFGYVNPDDPSLFVEDRFGYGFTPNWGNPKVAAFFVGLLFLFAAAGVIYFLGGFRTAGQGEQRCR